MMIDTGEMKKSNQKGKIWCDFCKSVGHHPLEKCYGYMYAQSIVDKHRSESVERKSPTKNHQQKKSNSWTREAG